MNALVGWLETNGFERVATVRDAGEFAVRGGILDLFAPGPESRCGSISSATRWNRSALRSGQPAHHRPAQVASTLAADERGDARRRTRSAGSAAAMSSLRRAARDDRALRRGQRGPALCRHGALAAALLRRPGDPVRLSARRAGGRSTIWRDEAAGERLDADRRLLRGAHGARAEGAFRDAVPTSRCRRICSISSPSRHGTGARRRAASRFRRSPRPRRDAGRSSMPARGRAAAFADGARRIRTSTSSMPPSATSARSAQAGRRVVSPPGREGSLDRLGQVLDDHGLGNAEPVGTPGRARKLDAGRSRPGRAAARKRASRPSELCVIAEQDILGDRLVRPLEARAAAAADFIAEASSLTAGDLVVHIDHGIGRFVGLKTIEAAGAPHDCLEIHYAGDDRLFLPVENIELLSRYGSDDSGGPARQARRRRLAGAQGAAEEAGARHGRAS